MSVSYHGPNLIRSEDINRQRVVMKQSLVHLVKRVNDPRLNTVVIPVLYNICIDYGESVPTSPSDDTMLTVGTEPTQELAGRQRLCPALIELLARGGPAPISMLGYICRLLDITIPKCELTRLLALRPMLT